MRPGQGGLGQGPARARVLTAGLSFQAAAAGPGPWGSGAECGAPAAPVLHVTAQGRQGPHHRGLRAGRDLPGQPPAGAEGRGGERFPCWGHCLRRAGFCQQWVPVPGSPAAFLPCGQGWWPWLARRALGWHRAELRDSTLRRCSWHRGDLWTPAPFPRCQRHQHHPALVPVLASCCRA